MTHPLIEQLRFTRREWLRGLEGVSEAETAHPQLIQLPGRPTESRIARSIKM